MKKEGGEEVNKVSAHDLSCVYVGSLKKQGGGVGERKRGG